MSGMGIAARTLSRMVASGPYGKLHIDRYPVSGYSTAHSGDAWVTDTAAAGTAFACGYKTNNGSVGIMADGQRKVTLFDRAASIGKSVGIVSTGRVTNPFCASFYSHLSNKYLENDAAEQMIKKKITLLYGGGRISFLPETEGGIRPDNVNYLNVASRGDYLVISNKKQLHDIDPARNRIIGIFADSKLSFEIDRAKTKEPSLYEMTSSALYFLNKNQKGFCLLVDSARIQDACKDHDAAALVKEIVHTDKVANLCREFAQRNPETLVLVLSASSTGGLIISEFVDTVEIDALKSSCYSMASKFDSLGQNFEDVLRLYGGIRLLTKPEKDYILTYLKSKLLPAAVGDVISNRAGLFWMPLHIQKKTVSFTGNVTESIPISAFGKNSFLFSGYHDNTQIGRLLFEAAGFDFKK
jgi:alkaline phosphatase